MLQNQKIAKMPVLLS